MIVMLIQCSLRDNVLQGIGQTNDIQLQIYPEFCDEIFEQPVSISLQIGNIQLTPHQILFNNKQIIYTERLSLELYEIAKQQNFGNFAIQFNSGETNKQSFTKIQFTNTNLTNCWQNLTMAYSSNKNQVGFTIEVIPAFCAFERVVTTRLMYQTSSGWNSIVIKSGGSYNSQNYNHMQTTNFQRLCRGIFTQEEVDDCFTFLNYFQQSRNMKIKLVIEYFIGEIQISVQKDLTSYYTPNYQNCMEKLDLTLFITLQTAVVNFKKEEFLLCEFILENVILTMEIQLDSDDFSYNQKKNFSISETLYFPQASFYFEDIIKQYIFKAKQPFVGHFFLSIFDYSSNLLQQASLLVKPTVSCFNYMNFTISKDKVCLKIKYNNLSQCKLSSTVPITFKGMWVLEDAPPLSGELIQVFEISKQLMIDYSRVEQKVCMTCNDNFTGGNCELTLAKFSKFHIQNSMYILIGIESLFNKSTDYLNYMVSFSTDIYLDVIIIGQSMVAILFLLFFSYFLYRSNRRETQKFNE